MLDHYSNYPAPPLKEKVNDVIRKLINTNKIQEQQKEIAREYAEKLLKVVPEAREYSYTGWCVFGIGDYADLVEQIVRLHVEHQQNPSNETQKNEIQRIIDTHYNNYNVVE